MSGRSMAELLRDAASLDPEDKLALASRLVDDARRALQAARPKRRWADWAGSARDLLGGKDAQEWVREQRARDQARPGGGREPGE